MSENIHECRRVSDGPDRRIGGRPNRLPECQRAFQDQTRVTSTAWCAWS